MNTQFVGWNFLFLFFHFSDGTRIRNKNTLKLVLAKQFCITKQTKELNLKRHINCVLSLYAAVLKTWHFTLLGPQESQIVVLIQRHNPP